jgi:hypothetical protein
MIDQSVLDQAETWRKPCRERQDDMADRKGQKKQIRNSTTSSRLKMQAKAESWEIIHPYVNMLVQDSLRKAGNM